MLALQSSFPIVSSNVHAYLQKDHLVKVFLSYPTKAPALFLFDIYLTREQKSSDFTSHVMSPTQYPEEN